jgi:hypothetical protein
MDIVVVWVDGQGLVHDWDEMSQGYLARVLAEYAREAAKQGRTIRQSRGCHGSIVLKGLDMTLHIGGDDV